VPLIVHYPGVLEPRVDERPVELLHLAPTILEAAGVELAEGRWMQGQSLTPRLRGMAPAPSAEKTEEAASEEETATAGAWQRPPGLAFAEAGWETKGKWQKVVRDDRFKLIFAQTRPEQRWIGGEGVRFTLFDLHNDPEETENVAERFPEDLERLKRELARWNSAEPFNVLVDPSQETCGDQRSMDDETRKLLESLGYL
jgi:arylsulfatase A-like enzyme